MRKDNNEAFLVLVVVVVGTVAYLSYNIATVLGAAFDLTFEAVTKTILIFGVMIVVNYFTQGAFFWLSLGIAMLFVWPQWWPVIDSIAYGGNAASEWGRHYIDVKDLHPWYMSWWFKWGIEGVIGALTAFPYFRNNYRY